MDNSHPQHISKKYQSKLERRERWENNYPILGAQLALVLPAWMHEPFVPLAYTLPGPTLALMVMIVAFTTTAITILLASPSLPALNQLRRTDTAEKLVTYYRWTINVSAVAAILSIVLAVMVGDGTNPLLFDADIHRITLSTWLASVVAALLYFYRSTSLLIRLLQRHLGEK